MREAEHQFSIPWFPKKKKEKIKLKIIDASILAHTLKKELLGLPFEISLQIFVGNKYEYFWSSLLSSCLPQFSGKKDYT